MANNNALYDAVVAGAVGGCEERWITSPISASYNPIALASQAFAIEVDAAIPPIPGGPTEAQVNLMVSIVNGVLAGRNIVDIVPATYISIANAIAGLFIEISTISLLNIPPGTIGSNPLTSAIFVDRNTAVPLTEQNGFIGTPFELINTAITACPTGGTIYAAPGDYSAEGAINIPAGKNITIIGLGYTSNSVILGSPVNVDAGGTISLVSVTAFTLNLVDLTTTGNLNNCVIVANVIGNGTLLVKSSTVAGQILALSLNGEKSNFQGNITISTGANCIFTDCIFSAINFTFSGVAGTVTLDNYSGNYFYNGTVTTINGTLTIIDGNIGPAVRVDATGTGQIALNGINTPIIWTTQLFGSPGMWNAGTPTILTCTRTGLYTFIGELNVTVGPLNNLRLLLNGATQIGRNFVRNTGDQTQQVVSHYLWTVGQTVQLNTITNANSPVGDLSWFSAVWLRPSI
jgi:hypothetical protein